ncbi:MAG: restriction endonuclease subunit S [Pontibacterium sp.]
MPLFPTKKLDDVVERVCVGYVGSCNEDYTESVSGVPMVRTTNLTGISIDYADMKYISHEFHKKNVKSQLKRGDILVARHGDNGLPSIYESDDAANCLNVVLVKPFLNINFVDNYYLLYALKCPFVVHQIKSSVGGSVQGVVNTKVIAGLEIPYPQRAIRKKIVDILFSLDKKIELNRQTNQTLEQIAQAIFKSWFVDFEPTRAKINALENGECPERAAMAAISGKPLAELDQLPPDTQQQLKTTAALFPDALVESELGEIPEGWEVLKVGDVVNRLKSKNRYTKKQVEPFGSVPVYEQGADILLGYHNGIAGFSASAEKPLFVFGDHTCVIHLSCEDFDISQNVIPLSGNRYPTIWVYYAIQGKQEFQEYRRHWSELIIKELVAPPIDITDAYAKFAISLYKHKEQMVRENKTLEQIRDFILPKLLSGELTPESVAAEKAP